MTQPINFRDVGETLAILLDEPPPIPPGMLFRGGKFDALSAAEDLGRPASILNLRRGPDPEHLPHVERIHVPAENTLENYDTLKRRVRVWIRAATDALLVARWPVYVHCTSGKDRTGVVVAAVLAGLGVSDAIIVEEYLLSDGVEEANIQHALRGIRRHLSEVFDGNLAKTMFAQTAQRP